MIEFRQFITEGGNVSIDGNDASRIDLTTISRSEIVKDITTALTIFNSAYEKANGLPIWGKELFNDKSFLSGSAFHFFNTTEISDKDFVEVKPTVGDIDTQVDGEQAESLKSFLDSSKGKSFGELKLIGYKNSAGQYISLWEFKKYNMNMQIDFELVHYANGRPTPWSQFSHASAWNDMKKGVKGVASKYLYRALMAPKLKQVIIKAKTARGKDKTVLAATHSFSVSHGVRQKLEPVMKDGTHVHENDTPTYSELNTAMSSGTTDLNTIFSYFFGANPTNQEISQFSSFIGTIDLIIKYVTPSDWDKIADGFANTLWGSGAQGLYRGNKLDDFREKTAMMTILLDRLGLKKDYESLTTPYYKSYK